MQVPLAWPFAASGTCVATQGGKRAWITTGGAAKARILATTDGGDSWTAYDTPITQGTPISGGLSVAFRDPHHGILAGGDLGSTTPPTDNVAVSDDGGATWTLTTPDAVRQRGLRPGVRAGVRPADGGGHGPRGRGLVAG